MRSESQSLSVVLNDMLQASGWEVEAEWNWSQPGHINVLESRSLIALYCSLILEGGNLRFPALLDSRVAKGAHAKGRSSARVLRPSLLRGCAYTLAGNLHPSLGFAPTRLNTADAPTRDRDLPVPATLSILDFLSPAQAIDLHSRQFSRGAAGWIRLYILAVACLCPVDGFCFDEPAPIVSGFWISPHCICQCLCLGFLLGFVATVAFGFSLSVGFPRDRSHQFAFSWTFPSVPQRINSPQKWLMPIIALIAVLHAVPCHAMPLAPAGSEEQSRAARRAGNVLVADRVVLQQTRTRREILLTAFDNWLAINWRTTLEALLNGPGFNCESVSEALVAYGRDMYQAGKSYGRFSETINAVTAKRPILRRQVASAWDLAFNWVVDEPHEHHAALPHSVLLSVVALSLLWGWTRESALIALAWTGVCRIGEIFAAKRGDLILPCDAAPGLTSAIFLIKAPKTRGRAARHQSTRIDPEDIVMLLSAVFRNLLPGEPLWPFSPATLRRRFTCLLAALGMTVGEDGQMPYSLSSLRPGGATYWLAETEDAEFVRRKGRWLSTRVLEIYLQEAAVATYDKKLSSVTKSRIADLCKNFQSILEKAIFLKTNKIPETVWAHLW